MPRIKQSAETPKTSKPSQRDFAAIEQVVSVWLVNFSRNFRRDLASGDLDVYLEGLHDIVNADFLDSACKMCLADCFFMPTVADIRASYEKIIFESTHYDKKSSANPAEKCEHKCVNWYVMRSKTNSRGVTYQFAVECPAIERHRSDWAESHPAWQYNPPKFILPKVSEVGN
jgi:hypothetical protein